MLNGMFFRSAILSIILTLLLHVSCAFAQHSSEKNIFSFQTAKNKQCSLSLDTLSQTIIYRFGTSKHIELEVSDNLYDADTVFTYDYYFRGGGKQNCGLDLNTVSFRKDDVRYCIYYNYSAESGKTWMGFDWDNGVTGESGSIRGKLKTMKGSLVDFRFNELIPVIENGNL